MKILSVTPETRRYYLTTAPNPNGPGVMAVISLGSPQYGDTNVVVCSVTVRKSIRAANNWFKKQMKTRPWDKEAVQQTVEVPKALGSITGFRTHNGKLIADTESGTPMVVPIKPTEDST